VASFKFLRERGDNIFDQPIIKLKKNSTLTITLHYITIAFLSQYKKSSFIILYLLYTYSIPIQITIAVKRVLTDTSFERKIWQRKKKQQTDGPVTAFIMYLNPLSNIYTQQNYTSMKLAAKCFKMFLKRSFQQIWCLFVCNFSCERLGRYMGVVWYNYLCGLYYKTRKL